MVDGPNFVSLGKKRKAAAAKAPRVRASGRRQPGTVCVGTEIFPLPSRALILNFQADTLNRGRPMVHAFLAGDDGRFPSWSSLDSGKLLPAHVSFQQ